MLLLSMSIQDRTNGAACQARMWRGTFRLGSGTTSPDGGRDRPGDAALLAFDANDELGFVVVGSEERPSIPLQRETHPEHVIRVVALVHALEHWHVSKLRHGRTLDDRSLGAALGLQVSCPPQRYHAGPLSRVQLNQDDRV